MQDGRDFGATDFEATVRRAFARLTRDELPKAAARRDWPVRTPEAFEELLLGHLEAHARPCIVDLVLAVELGEGLLAGNLCCRTMNRRLRCEAAEGDPRRAEALKSLLQLLASRG